MPGTYQYDVEIKSNVAKLLSDMKQVQDRLSLLLPICLLLKRDITLFQVRKN